MGETQEGDLGSDSQGVEERLGRLRGQKLKISDRDIRVQFRGVDERMSVDC